MTSMQLTRPATPVPVTLVRWLVAVQTVIGIGTTLLLGFLALLGLAWTTDDAGHVDGLVVAVTAMFALSLAATVAVPVLAGALRPGANGVRIALVVVEAVVGAGTALLLGVGALVLAPAVSLGCSVGSIVALTQRSTRTWVDGPRYVAA